MTDLLLSLMIGLLPIAATLWVKVMLFRQNESEECTELFRFAESDRYDSIRSAWKRLPAVATPASVLSAGSSAHGSR